MRQKSNLREEWPPDANSTSLVGQRRERRKLKSVTGQASLSEKLGTYESQIHSGVLKGVKSVQDEEWCAARHEGHHDLHLQERVRYTAETAHFAETANTTSTRRM